MSQDWHATARRLLVEAGDILVPNEVSQGDLARIIDDPTQPSDNQHVENVRRLMPVTPAQFEGRVRVQTVALTTAARQTFRTILGGQSVRVNAFWQPLNRSWNVGLIALDGTPIVASMRLSPGSTPLRGLVVKDFVGELFVSGSGNLGRHAWDESNELIYLAAESAL